MTRLMPTGLLMSLLLLLLSAGRAPAATIAFLPDSTTAIVGASLSIDVVISGLGTGASPSVSAFDLMVAFDQSILNATGVAFGAFLGEPSLFEAITDFTISSASVNFAEVSLLGPATLDTLQPGSFPVVTLTFQVVGAGLTTLTFVSGTVPGVPGLAVHDAFGDLLTVTGSDGVVNATNTGVPEPASVLLAIAGSLLMRIVARRRSQTGRAGSRDS